MGFCLSRDTQLVQKLQPVSTSLGSDPWPGAVGSRLEELECGAREGGRGPGPAALLWVRTGHAGGSSGDGGAPPPAFPCLVFRALITV